MRVGRWRNISVKPTASGTYASGPPRFGTQLTLFAGDSPVNPSVSLAREKPKTMRGGCGPSSPEFLASFDPDTWLLKTSQACVVEGWETFSETLPRSGMMRTGRVYRLPTLVPHTDENVFGYWPTPRTTGLDGGSNSRNAAKKRGMWPTPTGQDSSNNAGPSQYRRNSLPLNAVIGGQLNPTWVEWLMGFPLGWTDLSVSETQSFPNVPTKSSVA